MAIFGWNGLMGLSLYFATLFAVYGTKNASFRDSAEFAKIEKLVQRKAATSAKGPEQKKAVLGQIRAARLKAMAEGGERYATLAADAGFKKGYAEKQWVR